MREKICGKRVPDLIDYLFGETDEKGRKQVEEHVASCSGCRLFLERARGVLQRHGNARPLPPETYWEAFPSAVIERIRDRLEIEARRRLFGRMVTAGCLACMVVAAILFSRHQRALDIAAHLNLYSDLPVIQNLETVSQLVVDEDE